ncbi:hypothetical protein [Pseudozobellia sp. WGM2]|uniref:hypothetical protein n=1 Tax=Pseudozobellia sp. WGM2 TaxID=2787625 RepID=UPI001ADFB4CF|nr:hypothetical protein [Pseudozobellia sp. WGM2]
MSTAQRVIKNTGFLYAKMAITMFISLYTTRLVLNALGASDFGIFNVVGGAIAMLGFLHAAMSSATQRFMSFYEGKGDTEKQKYIFNVSTVLHFGIAILLIVVLLIAGYFFFNGILNIPPDRVFAAKVIYGALILSTAFTVLSVPYEAVLNAHENMLYYSIVGVVESLLKLSVALIIVKYAGDKLVLYGILMAVIPFVIRTIMQVYCHKKYEECVIAPRKYFEKDLMKEMSNFAGWSFLGTTISMISFYGQGVVLNFFFGTIVNAAHGIANQVNGMLMVFSSNMLMALNPVIVKKEGSGNQLEMINLAITGSKFSFALLAFFAVPVIIEMPYILKIWLKDVPDYAIIFCRLLLIKTLIEQMVITLSTSIAATGNIKQYQIIISLLAIIPLVATYAFFYYGYEPYLLYIIYIVHVSNRCFVISVYFANKLCGLPVKQFLLDVIMKEIGIVALAALIPVFLYYRMDFGVVRLVSIGLTYTISFCLLFYFFNLNTKEKAIVTTLVESVSQKLPRR